MKRTLITSLLLVASIGLADSTKVALLDFQDLTGAQPDALLGGTVAPGALAGKGVYLLGQALLEDASAGYTLVDRREFIRQMEALRPTDAGKSTPTQPSFLHAAQALQADAVLRGQLLSFSTGNQTVNQGGFHTDFKTVSVRVSLEALDTVDGAVIAMSEGRAEGSFRQTTSTHTSLGEDEVITLLGQAIDKALPNLQNALDTRLAKAEEKPVVKVSVTTSDDPALIEIDGILVGSSPLTEFEVYEGDHVLTVGKPGYYDVTKRILFKKDVAIEVPLIRVKLNADEMKEVLEKARLHIFEGEPGLIIHEINETIAP